MARSALKTLNINKAQRDAKQGVAVKDLLALITTHSHMADLLRLEGLEGRKDWRQERAVLQVVRKQVWPGVL